MARRITPQRARPESATPPKLTERVGIAILSVSSSQIDKGFSEEVRESFECEFVTTRHFTLFCRSAFSFRVATFINSSVKYFRRRNGWRSGAGSTWTTSWPRLFKKHFA